MIRLIGIALVILGLIAQPLMAAVPAPLSDGWLTLVPLCLRDVWIRWPVHHGAPS